MRTVDEAVYNRVFRWIVTSGMTCGLNDEIAAALAAEFPRVDDSRGKDGVA